VNGKKNFSGKLKKGLERIRTQGLFSTLWHYRDIWKEWIRIVPFYYMKEVVSADIPAHLTAIPDGFEFSAFTYDDIMEISKLEERKDYIYEQYVIECFNAGDSCIGIKYNGKIAAFTWFSLEKCRAWHYPSTMNNNEAYLYDMYVLKPFRRNNLAPILRYKNYEILRDLGRDTFYSITECSNRASFKFKQKLGAEVIFLGISIHLFNKYSARWVLKRY
jgi:hypothetical protein